MFFNTGTVNKRQYPKDKSARKLTDPAQLLVLHLAMERPGIKLQEIQEELLNLLLVNIHISTHAYNIFLTFTTEWYINIDFISESLCKSFQGGPTYGNFQPAV